MKLFYRKFGEGPALIIIHGLYGSSDNWVSFAKALSSHFEVFLIDQRNHGKSPHSEHHDYPSMREDLREFMDDQAIDKAVLLGHSMGGKTAMFFAAGYPERLNALIVVDISPASYLGSEKQSSGYAFHQRILQILSALDLTSFSTRKEIDQALSQTIYPVNLRQFLLKNLYRNKDNHFSWKLNIQSLYKNLPHIMDGLKISDYENGEKITGFPVLFIRGGESPYIGEEDRKIILQIFPFAEIQTIPGTGHWVHVEKGEALLETVLRFIAGN